MKIISIPMNFYKSAGMEKPTMTAYLQEETEEIKISHSRDAVIVCPGGAYKFRSDREAEVIALSFLAKGKQAFVLNYSVAPAKFPCALVELAAAVATVRTYAAEWNINAERIFVCGFSAGGHLTASLGTMWQEPFLQEALKESFGSDNELWKPSGLVLCYPVITMGKYTHEESRDLLLGENASEYMIQNISLENRVTSKVPPVFIWHTMEDEAVPVENTLQFVTALQKEKVPYEMHVFEKGEHGIALCNEVTEDRVEQVVPDNEAWIDMSLRWMKRR